MELIHLNAADDTGTTTRRYTITKPDDTYAIRAQNKMHLARPCFARVALTSSGTHEIHHWWDPYCGADTAPRTAPLTKRLQRKKLRRLPGRRYSVHMLPRSRVICTAFQGMH
jgi:hypothetical protein